MSHRGQLQRLNTPSAHYSPPMTPTSSQSPVPKMATPHRSASQDSTADNIRKRVCKACDRCRLKKSKCDGSNPCSRCKADNAICVFGERKKSHDKVYPKGYVEMLEQQQSQLVSGLQEMYKRLRAASAWTGEDLSESNGHPLTHDILAALDLLEVKHDGSGELEPFEEDCGKLQSKLLAEGAGYTQRRGSFSSDSEQSHSHAHSVSHNTPVLSKPSMFKDSFDFSAPPSPPPLEHSPVAGPWQKPSFAANQPSPLQQSSPLPHDPQFYQAQWAISGRVPNAEFLPRSKFNMQMPELDQAPVGMGDVNPFGQWDASPDSYDAKYDFDIMATTSYPQNLTGYGNMPKLQDGGAAMSMDPMVDVEFNQFLSICT